MLYNKIIYQTLIVKTVLMFPRLALEGDKDPMLLKHHSVTVLASALRMPSVLD